MMHWSTESKGASGLGASMWARGSNGRSHLFTPAAHQNNDDARSRSLPPPEPPTATSAVSASPSGSAHLPLPQIFHRFEQACQRLRWKFLDLQNSYARATSPADYAFTRADAETNFKVDFHEFYAWIEQALVLLLLVFGRTIPRGTGPSGQHAYHHNVLKALEDESCAVHGALGTGDVNQALWKAKELRNRWKDAAEGRETPPLKMYDLTWIVTQILGGLEEGYAIAARRVEEEGGSAAAAEEEWEWMVDGMDWQRDG